MTNLQVSIAAADVNVWNFFIIIIDLVATLSIHLTEAHLVQKTQVRVAVMVTPSLYLVSCVAKLWGKHSKAEVNTRVAGLRRGGGVEVLTFWVAVPIILTEIACSVCSYKRDSMSETSFCFKDQGREGDFSLLLGSITFCQGTPYNQITNY